MGVRPEYVTLASANSTGALNATVTQVQDIGTYWLLNARVGDCTVRARLSPDAVVPRAGETVWLQIAGPHTCWYAADETLISAGQDEELAT